MVKIYRPEEHCQIVFLERQSFCSRVSTVFVMLVLAERGTAKAHILVQYGWNGKVKSYVLICWCCHSFRFWSQILPSKFTCVTWLNHKAVWGEYIWACLFMLCTIKLHHMNLLVYNIPHIHKKNTILICGKSGWAIILYAQFQGFKS